MTGLQRISELADGLAAEVRAFAEMQTLSEHIRDRGEWTRIEVGAEKLRKEIFVMAELARARTPDLFDSQASA